MLNRAQRWASEALKEVRGRLPFPVLGLGSDNDSELTGAHLKCWCDAERMVFTRSGPSRKNDVCQVEHKNWLMVRGHDRPRRACRRVPDDPDVSDERRAALRSMRASPDPAYLDELINDI